MKLHSIDLPGGPLQYLDTGGPGRSVVLLHGVLMDETVWQGVVDRLPELRCVVPVLPLGAHRRAMPSGSDLRPARLAELLLDFLTALNVRDAALVGNDTGGAVAQLLIAAHPEVTSGLVLVSCDAFDNFPPGLPGRVMAAAAAIPGGLQAAVASMRWRPLRRLPLTFGWMIRPPMPDATMDRWLAAYAADRGVQRDLHKVLAGVDRKQLVAAADHLAQYDKPALIVWAADDRVMPVEHAHRLANLLPNARLELIENSYTVVPLDQPAALAALIDGFVRRLPTVAGDHRGRATDEPSASTKSSGAARE